MHELRLVAVREFNERVRTRSFVIGTVLLPLVLVAVTFLPGMVGDAKSRSLVVVSDAPPSIAQMFVLSLNRMTAVNAEDGAAEGRYRVEVVTGPLAERRAALIERMEADELDGYIHIPADVRETGRVQFRSTRVAEPSMMRDIRQAANEAVQADRLANAGLQLDRLAGILRPVTIDDGRLDQHGGEAGSAHAGFYFAYFVALVIYIMIALYGSGVTRSVLEEKNNRIAEVLVSSMRATDLMAGKILGVGAAVMLQILIWIGSMALLISQSELIARQLNIDPSALNTIVAQPGTTALLVGYFILGFLLFAAMFAALGAAVTTDQEAQSFQMLFMIPLFVPLLFLLQLTTQPLEPLARTLALIPFTAPVAMPMRMAAARIPVAEVLLSLLLLLVALILTAWVAGRIYRIGILSTGRRPSLRELAQWLRAT